MRTVPEALPDSEKNYEIVHKQPEDKEDLFSGFRCHPNEIFRNPARQWQAKR